ncbi:MAG: ABC transporter ATP-binding protein [Rikenellaceae bacterium]
MVHLQNLSFSYSKNRKIFSDLSLNIEKGTICGLLGKNGVGKTTLLNLMAGLLRPSTNASISVMGYEPFARSVEFLSSVFILPEEFSLPRTSVQKFAELYGRFYPQFSWELFEEVLGLFEVSASEKLNTISFGQRKKAYIAFAVACRTKLLIMDEPTNGLDIPSKMAFRRIIAQVMNDERTIVISTHQVRDLEEMLDRIIVLENEGVLLNASVGEITEKLRFELLDSPEGALFAQQSLQGLVGVRENTEGGETMLDLELLFNAVVQSSERVAQIFEK